MRAKNQSTKSAILLVITLALFLISLNFISAEASYCCEKTTSGAWCQNAPQSECDSGFKSAPTACDSTSYCKRGCCFDSHEGLCMENTAQRVCEEAKGTWANDAQCGIIQCKLGCCVLADQGAFVTLTRCKQLSGFYGLQTDFRSNINDELTCISTASSADIGACVRTDPATGGKTCKFGPRSECKEGEARINITAANETIGEANATAASTGFYKDILCSAEELGTDCGPSTKTMLLQGKDEVYFTDSCGNQANIYDASRYSDKMYWKKVYKKSESCGAGSSNAGSASCGNCDYFLGSVGRQASGIARRPTYGSYICIDLSCKSAGKKHGESWCVSDDPSGEGKDPVGSRYFKEVCLNGEVITEPCGDFRGQICIEDEFNGFTEAACRTNRWQDCLKQEEQEDCENEGARDCLWKKGYYYSETSQQIEKSINETEAKKKNVKMTPEGICLPNYPPGFNFYGASDAIAAGASAVGTTGTGTVNFSGMTPAFGAQTPAFGTGYVDPTKDQGALISASRCQIGNTKVEIKWKRTKRIDSTSAWQCANEECVKYDKDPAKANITEAEAKDWAKAMNEFCYTLSDCGGYINFIGAETEDGYAAYLGQKRVAGSGGAKILEASSNLTATSTAAASQPAASASTTGTGVAGIGSVVLDLIKSTVGGRR